MTPRAHPNFAIRKLHVGRENAPVAVVDDVVAAPEELQDLAAGKLFAPVTSYYPGIRAKAPLSYNQFVLETFAGLFTDFFGLGGRTLRMTQCHFSLVTTPATRLSYLQSIPHVDTYASGGMYGPAGKRALVFSDGTRVPITGWEYQVAPAGLDAPLRSPWEATAGVSMIYNAMIAPLRNYTLRGVAWYQGESNTSVPEGRQYQAQLTALFADWRRQFEAPLPFLVVQLANYGPMAPKPVESGWALTREAERRAVIADGNAGLAVTIDIGNRDDVHPTNKQEVGRRLARAARRVVFGENVSASGPMPLSARRDGQSVLIDFDDVEGALVVYNSRDPAAFEVCAAGEGTCQFVSARLSGASRVELHGIDANAVTRVRYCWADSPLCNLYDGAGLPPTPFQLPVD